jgi:chemotaxis methyl-accepting protein methylase
VLNRHFHAIELHNITTDRYFFDPITCDRVHFQFSDFNKNEIVHKFDEQMRRDSKLLLAKGKCIILEPFRKLKMYSITGDRIKEIPVSSDIV